MPGGEGLALYLEVGRATSSANMAERGSTFAMIGITSSVRSTAVGT